jgi:hypothetical protein
MPKTAPPLSRRLQAAFARLDPATPVPAWPRAVRIGADYALRASGMDPTTDREADGLALVCFILGNLAERDPKGDPPATVTAQERACRAGPDHARAFAALSQLRDASIEWARHGWAVPTPWRSTRCGSCSGPRGVNMSGKMCSLRSLPQPNMSRVSSVVAYSRPTRIRRPAPKARTMRRHRPGDDIARARKASRPSTQPPAKRKSA